MSELRAARKEAEEQRSKKAYWMAEFDKAQARAEWQRKRGDTAYKLVKERGLKLAAAFKEIRDLRAEVKRLKEGR